MSKGFGAPTSSPPSATIKKLKRSVMKQFEGLDDPRVKREPKHLLVDILTIAILAVLFGADNMVAFETYGKAKQQWLETLSCSSYCSDPVGMKLLGTKNERDC